jgi:hypothetical protein
MNWERNKGRSVGKEREEKEMSTEEKEVMEKKARNGVWKKECKKNRREDVEIKRERNDRINTHSSCTKLTVFIQNFLLSKFFQHDLNCGIHIFIMFRFGPDSWHIVL